MSTRGLRVVVPARVGPSEQRHTPCVFSPPFQASDVLASAAADVAARAVAAHADCATYFGAAADEVGFE